ncbi:MAG: ABC transporter permease [Bacteroidota bacterium]
MYRKLFYNFLIGLEALWQNLLRAVLTSLGIVFGVASVIAMLAIGRGAKEEILSRMDALGVNNIIVNPIIQQEEGDLEEEGDVEDNQPVRFTPGLTLADAQSLLELPFVEDVSPEVVLESMVVRNARKRSVKLVGVTNAYFEDSSFELVEGKSFQPVHQEQARPVCVIGYGIKTRFFPTEEPIGKQIKCGKHWMTVIGVLEPRNISREVRNELGIRNYDLDVYIPIQTVLLRYVNRASVTRVSLERAARDNDDDEAESRPPANYHQLDRLVVRVADTRYMYQLAEVIQRMLQRRHNYVVDFEIIVPEMLLKQKQETTDMLNLVLGAIASISLLVGGIGIMNIMLASVLERIREIGLRLALGATKRDVILQFMSEAVIISLTGGILGIILGVSLSLIIEALADIDTVISGASVLLAFFVSVAVGLLFGIYPAVQAAKQDPVVSLRSGA